jgi:hypothetical protein
MRLLAPIGTDFGRPADGAIITLRRSASGGAGELTSPGQVWTLVSGCFQAG